MEDSCTGRTIPAGSTCRVTLQFLPFPSDYGDASTPPLVFWHDGYTGSDGTQLVGYVRSHVTTTAWGWDGFGALGGGRLQTSLLGGA